LSENQPLSLKKDTYYEPIGKQIDEFVPNGASSFRWAVEKAERIKMIHEVVVKGVYNVADIWVDSACDGIRGSCHCWCFYIFILVFF
jgi:hypothetical protein